jgi:small subunit ribosomal protein S5
MEDKKIKTEGQAGVVAQGASETVAADLYGGNRKRNFGGAGGGAGGGARGRGGRGGRDDRSKDEFEQRILEVARVTRVMAGGKRMNFRACVALGDKKGNVGVGLGKGADVTMAVNKAVNRAKKTMVNVPMVKDTIPHAVLQKMGAARIMLKPAKAGRGVISGGVTRVILELAGVKNITSKALGSKNKINNARCTIAALRGLRRAEVKTEVKKEKSVEPVVSAESKK